MARQGAKQSGSGIVEILLIALVVVVLGAIGTYTWQWQQKTETQKPNASQSNNVEVKTDPYAGWKTYSSATERLSFKYPPDWTIGDHAWAYTESADAIQLLSPSGNVGAGWTSQISGLGGACDRFVMPGTEEAKNDPLGACTYFKVLDKQKLAGADLYFVAGVQTADGKNYSPWLALQDSKGILSSQGSPGYLIFQGKYNNIIDNGHDYGVAAAKFTAGQSNLPPSGNLTEAQATALLATPEFQQAKLILLSASY